MTVYFWDSSGLIKRYILFSNPQPRPGARSMAAHPCRWFRGVAALRAYIRWKVLFLVHLYFPTST